MKRIIASSLLPQDIKNTLSTNGFSIVEGGFSTIIDNETAYHPDMLYFKTPSGKLIISDKISSVHNLDTFQRAEKTKTPQGQKYPEDCALNCFLAKKHLICGGYVANEIITECSLYGIDIIKVKQGYAACSTVKVTDEAFITADAGIYKALISNSYKALLVTNEGIKLKGYGNGFIGGCALVSDNEIFFTGDITKHRDYKLIESFCKEHGKNVISLTKDDLYDYGGFIVL